MLCYFFFRNPFIYLFVYVFIYLCVYLFANGGNSQVNLGLNLNLRRPRTVLLETKLMTASPHLHFAYLVLVFSSQPTDPGFCL